MLFLRVGKGPISTTDSVFRFFLDKAFVVYIYIYLGGRGGGGEGGLFFYLTSKTLPMSRTRLKYNSNCWKFGEMF